MDVITIEEVMLLRDDNYLVELLGKGRQLVKVRCFDGEAETRYSLLAFAYAYFRFNKKYNVPVSVKQIPAEDALPGNGLHMKLLQAGLKHTYHMLKEEVPLNVIAEESYYIAEFQINQSIENLTEYAMALDAVDLWQIERDPEVMALKEEMRNGIARERTSFGKFKYIKQAYDKFKKLIGQNRLAKWRYNGYIQLDTSGSAKITQMNQGIITRGFCSDVNSDFFTEPVLNSFAEGLNDPYAFSLECASGAKAIMYQSDPMELTEYLHRLVQMLVASFQRMHLEDCGSRITYPFHVREAHLPYIVGKHYIDDDGTLQEIVAGDNTHLIGRTLQFRHVAGCQVKDKSGCCVKCAGAVGHSFSKGMNIGHGSATRFMGTGSQKVLSVKHEDLASLSLAMMVRDMFKNYLRLGSSGREIKLKRRNIRIGVPASSVPNIQYLHYTDDINKLSITEFSKIGQIVIMDNDDSESLGEVFKGSVGTQGEILNFSVELLTYLKDHPEKMTIEDYSRVKYYFIDLDEYDIDDAVFLAPFKHFDMLIQHKMTKRLLYSPRGAVKAADDMAASGPRLTDFHTFGEAATATLDITMEKLGINLSVLEMAIYPFTVTAPDEYDFSPVRATNTCQFMPLNQLYNMRSLAAKLVSERQSEVLRSPLAIVTQRHDHPYDVGFYDS